MSSLSLSIQTVLGTNLFDFEADGKLVISYMFWVFFAIAGPLTALTLGVWYTISIKKREAYQSDPERFNP